MEKRLAEYLIEEFSKHPGLADLDKNLFVETLASTEVPESKGFSQKLKDTEYLMHEGSSCYSYVSLREILRNENAIRCQLQRFGEIWGAVASAFGFYESDELTRNLRTNREILEDMVGSKSEFSLLGKIKTYDFGNPDETLFVITRPILVIPQAKYMKAIKTWEENNITYEREVGIFFRHLKRVSKKEYLDSYLEQSPYH